MTSVVEIAGVRGKYTTSQREENSSKRPHQSSPMTSTSALNCLMYSPFSSSDSSKNTSSTQRRAAMISRRSSCLYTGGRPFLDSFRASVETPTTRRSPKARARSRMRRWPTWKTSKVPKVSTLLSKCLAAKELAVETYRNVGITACLHGRYQGGFFRRKQQELCATCSFVGRHCKPESLKA